MLLAGETRRSETELPAIEVELATFGFRRILEGVEVRYELVRPDAYVLADPRQEGRIKFTVYLPEACAAPRGRRGAAPVLASRRIYLLDDWAEDRAGKLDALIQTAVWQMTPDGV